jgi:hypothetical protein
MYSKRENTSPIRIDITYPFAVSRMVLRQTKGFVKLGLLKHGEFVATN